MHVYQLHVINNLTTIKEFKVTRNSKRLCKHIIVLMYILLCCMQSPFYIIFNDCTYTFVLIVVLIHDYPLIKMVTDVDITIMSNSYAVRLIKPIVTSSLAAKGVILAVAFVKN